MYYKIRGNLKRIHPQIREPSNVLILTVIKYDSNLIDDRILSIFLDFGLNILALIRTHIVLT